MSEAPALYMGPADFASGSGMDDVGGGRGFVAAHDIAPGTVLCREVRTHLTFPEMCPQSVHNTKFQL